MVTVSGGASAPPVTGAVSAGSGPYVSPPAALENDSAIITIPASHITVGNEVYGSWEFDLHAKKADPATYANAVNGSNGFYRSITAASPTTKVGVVVDAGNVQANWDSTVLTLARGFYDFVEYHYYPQEPGRETDTYLVHRAAPDFTTSINRLKSELTAAGEPSTPIYVGEIGSVSSVPGKQSWSITQGLFAGQIHPWAT